MPTKRKLEHFDPNKSDSNDTDFEPDQPSVKRSRKPTKKRTSNPKKRIKRSKYQGSDISEEEDSLLEGSFTESSSSEEETELNPVTGRRVRKVAKKTVNYEEETGSDSVELFDEMNSDDSESKSKISKRVRHPVKRSETLEKEKGLVKEEVIGKNGIKPGIIRTRMVTLKIGTPKAGTPQRGLRSATLARACSLEQTQDSVGLEKPRIDRQSPVKEDCKPMLHSPPRDQSENSPEQSLSQKPERESKGLKKPFSVTREDFHETSPEPEDTTMVTEFATSDDIDETKKARDSPILKVDENSKIEINEPDSDDVAADDEDEENDEDLLTKPRRKSDLQSPSIEQETNNEDISGKAKSRRLTRGLKSKRRKIDTEIGSDFEPPDEISEDEPPQSDSSRKKGKDHESESSPGPNNRRTRFSRSKNSSRRQPSSDSADNELDQDEIAEELHDLKGAPRRRRQLRREDSEVLYERSGRARNKVDYTIKSLDQIYAADDDDAENAPTPNKRTTGGRNGAYQPWERNLFSTFGPFGGGGGAAPIIGGPWGTSAIGAADSDSSDDDLAQKSMGAQGNIGTTPTSGNAPGLLLGLSQTNNLDIGGGGGSSGNPANYGKVKSQKELADADPLGVDQNVDFSKVGGLENHINQLKEMVQMPLLYPELFLKFHVTPPRGVLFHGPPGTGKTLLARALAASVGSREQKITFYMRKGADALSKWVGEAERQLRLLFEEARKTQPSIIFFDEIDGLAPVRSSKQEQIHASIVSTLLALMDGMDGRGQVIVIGATNRPDNIDPALRRPGRFDREFYFPLPDSNARKSIINIHTRDWGLDESFKDSLAQVTKGYGGADLRALCTEAALNSIQRTFPQIYMSNDKLKIDATKIKVTAKDFMISVQKMVPSSERSTSSGAAPLPKTIEPLLRDQLKQIRFLLEELIPIKKKTTALQEAMYEQYEDEDHGFGREKMLQDFEKSRVFRPRLLIEGEPGMGQAYLGGAILNHFEGLHVQSFDLATLYSDSNRSPEAALVQLFSEVKRHKPSVIYLPSIETWYHTLSDTAVTTFLGLLRSIPPTDPILVLGITETSQKNISHDIVHDLFGISKQNRFNISRPSRSSRHAFFSTIGEYVKKSPRDYPDPLNRKKRKLEELELAPPPATRIPTREEIKMQKKKDHHLLNLLKVAIQPIMEQIQKKYKKFRSPVIPQSAIKYIFDEKDTNFVRSDLPGVRPYEIDKDKDGIIGLREVATGKFFYNLETTTIEERLSNGFYARPKDFLADIRSLTKDARRIGDKERILKAQELLTNVEVDIALIEQNPTFADCENLYLRQLQRVKEKNEKNKKRLEEKQHNLTTEHNPLQLLKKDDELPPNFGQASGNNLSVTSLVNSHLVNGISITSSSIEDVTMHGTDINVMQPPAQAHLNHVLNPDSSHPLTHISERPVLKEASHDSSLHELVNLNSLSNCPSRKISDTWSTRAENGIMTLISSSPADKPTQDSDIPDTQRNTQSEGSQEWPLSQPYPVRGPLYPSQSPSLVSQAITHMGNKAHPMVMPKSHPSGMANLLNDSSVEPLMISSQLQTCELNIDLSYVDSAINQFVDVTHSSSIEELEQIYRELMNVLWRMRGEWNRNLVVNQLVNIFNETFRDIKEMHQSLSSINHCSNDLVTSDQI
ncbi:hypothetical protein EPUL_005780 [Erysiphe pulchra]|uniref:AAA+ ATPase domain-containing protein n=1 Tax=Erysiphe pulchra TaxID=225359 RepID=A0A2S4PMU6_9PEZI|nr:hypothetical protein EPUL_005780 [Erysiphe pulchra]